MLIKDKAHLEVFFKEAPFLHLYSLGDLDDFFWPQTTWYGHVREGVLRAVFLLYRAPGLPVLLALEDRDPEAARTLLDDILPELPERFYAHVSPYLADRFARYRVDSHGEFLKMGLESLAHPGGAPEAEIRRLGEGDLAEALAFYREAYPGNWFDPRMLQTGKYFGAYRGRALMAVAGIHVYSAEYRVAALGNIATHPTARGQGLAARVTAELCRDLQASGVTTIGLNVKADNAAAIACYRRIGFEPKSRYIELMIEGLK